MKKESFGICSLPSGGAPLWCNRRPFFKHNFRSLGRRCRGRRCRRSRPPPVVVAPRRVVPPGHCRSRGLLGEDGGSRAVLAGEQVALESRGRAFEAGQLPD